MKGRKKTEEHKRKIGAAHKGRTLKEATKEKIRKTLLGRPNFSVMKKITQYNKDGVLMATYDSIKEASLVTGACCSKISACAKGTRKTSGGFVWKYIE